MADTANTGTNNWNTNGAWADATQPTAADDVTIPASATVTIPSATTALGRSLTVASGGALAFAATTSVLTLGDATAGAGNVAVSISSGATITITGIGTVNLNSTSATQQTIDLGGKTLPNITQGGAGSSYLWSAAVTSSGTVTLSAGTMNTGGFTCTAVAFNYGNATTRTLTMGSSTFNLSSTTSAWLASAGTGLTITANTAQINATGAFGSSNAIALLGLNWNGASFAMTGGGTPSISTGGTPTVANFTITGTAVKTNVYSFSGNLTCTGTFTTNANSDTNSILIQSNTLGTARTITAAAYVATNAIHYRDITGAGAATWTAAGSGASYLGDCLGNSGGLSFAATRTLYFIGSASGSFSDSTRFSLSSGGASASTIPRPQDDVVCDANSATLGSRTVTVDLVRPCRNLTAQGAANSQSISAANSFEIFGNYSNDGTWPNNFTSVTFTVSGRGTHTFNTNAQTLGSTSLAISAFGGSYSTSGPISTSATTTSLNWSAGTFNSNSHNMTFGSYAGNSGNAKVVNLGTSTLAATATGGTTPLIIGSIGDFSGTVNSTLTVATSASTKTITLGGGYWPGHIKYDNAGSTGAMIIGGGGRLGKLSFSDTNNARSLTVNADGTYIDDWTTVFGNATQNITIASSSAGTRRILGTKGANRVTLNRVTLQDIAWARPYQLYLTNSTDSGNNQNSHFTTPPSTPYMRQSADSGQGTTTSISATFDNAVTAGSLLLFNLRATSNPGTVTYPSGWTLLWDSGTSPKNATYYKIADGSETGATITSTLGATGTLYIMEVTGFAGTPTLDNSATNSTAAATSLLLPASSLAYGGNNGIALALMGANGGMGAFSTVPTNSYEEDYSITSGTNSGHRIGVKPLTAPSSEQTTLSWTTSRVPAGGMAVFKDVASTAFRRMLLGVGV